MDIIKRQEIFEIYKSLPLEELNRLIKKSRQHLQELNMAHRGKSQLEGKDNLLDPLPYVIRAEETVFLQNAVEQWGRLLSRVFRDLWGPQSLVQQGVLTPSVLWGDLALDPSFFHAIPQGVEPLSLFRLDLIRDVQGLWRLNSLGAGIPRGLGYTIETRIVHSRFFGSRVPNENLIRLAPFFQSLKDLWFQDSLTHKDEPNIMVWTSGPSDPLYFEPVYLSRYFGYPLVESRDLTVRQGKVFLKTLGGLQPIDVLIRMVSDKELDPLSGNPSALGGVAGLMHAVRDGSVLLTNAPGAELLDHPRLLPHYPEICQHLLGEELLLPPMAEMAPAGYEDFLDLERGWQSHPVGIQLFTARLAGRWELMPGGLVQKLGSQPMNKMGFEQTKKDLWFLSYEAVPQTSLLPPTERPSEINRAADLPSRVADDLFWLGRYTERAWMDMRFLEKWWELQYEGGPENKELGAGVIDALAKTMTILPEDLDPDEAVWARSRLSWTLQEIHRIAGQVLDRLSLETHRILRDFGHFLQGTQDQALPDLLRQVNLRLAAFGGLTMESMTRSSGWRFLDMGRRLERGLLVVECLHGFFTQPDHDDHLMLLLDLFDSTLTYRTRYRLSPQKGPVLDLLLLDEANPRSLAFQLESLSHHMEKLPRGTQRAYRSVEERTILELLTKVRLSDGTKLSKDTLESFLEEISEGLDHFSDALHQTYLAKIDPMESLQVRGRMEGL